MKLAATFQPIWASLALCLIVAACSTPPPAPPKTSSYVVLLEEENGSVGRVLFTGAHGTVELSQAQQATSLDGTQASYRVDPAVLRRDAQAAIAAQPLLPRTFIFHFDTSDSRITKGSEALLHQVQEELQRRQAPDVSITGHTDTAGEARRNALLAQGRAEYVARILRPFLANALAVDISSHGETNLLVPTANGVDEPRNRRVEVVVR